MKTVQERADHILDVVRQHDNRRFSVLLQHRGDTWCLDVYCHEGDELVLIDMFKGDDCGPFYELTKQWEDSHKSRLVPARHRVSASFELI